MAHRIPVDSRLALVEVCPNVTVRGGTVGLITLAKDGKGWTQLTPEEARALSRELDRAADESEIFTGEYPTTKENP